MMRYNRNRFGEDESCPRRAYTQNNRGCACTDKCRENNTARCERDDGQRGNCSCRTAQCASVPTNPCEAERLMTLIRRLDFALVETNLYLDTHPHSRTALNYFERLLHERNQAAERYETAFGPLTATGNGMRDEWTWSTGAWPWQIDKESKR